MASQYSAQFLKNWSKKGVHMPHSSLTGRCNFPNILVEAELPTLENRLLYGAKSIFTKLTNAGQLSPIT